MRILTDTNAVLTVVAADRVGLVAGVANFLFEMGGDIDANFCVREDDEFRGYFFFRISQRGLERLREQMNAQLAGMNARLQVVEGTECQRPYLVRHVGVNQPGIVARIARPLVGFGVNIHHVCSGRFQEAMVGTTMFSIEMIVEIPELIDEEDVRAALEKIDLGIEIEPYRGPIAPHVGELFEQSKNLLTDDPSRTIH